MRIEPGTRIGRYQVVGKIGSGGMGSVYEALQDEPRRTVALKLMNDGFADEESLHRFRYEAEVLGHLDHPGIARILEAGTHVDDDGRSVPWFAMEHVVGGTDLRSHADAADLDMQGRLELFAGVCDAVHHGHQRGIVHRDLKPGNILVDGAGRPRVIDFGVARSTNLDMARTGDLTGTGVLVGTVQYMSPEQCAGEPERIDVRSDIYSLGVVLYELLCGRLPYGIDNLLNAVWVITNEPPTRPSGVRKALRGDVEAVVLKALEKDPRRRYQSAAELSADLRRILDREPIAARTPTFVYHVRMMASRYRTLTGTAGGILIALIVGVVATTWQWREAVRSAEESAAVTAFLQGMLPSHVTMDPAQRHVPAYGTEAPIALLLDDGVASVPAAFADQPELESTTRLILSGGYWGVGLYERAEQQARLAVEARAALHGANAPTTLEARAALAEALRMLDRSDEAEAMVREVLAAYEAHPLYGAEHPRTVAAACSLAFVLWPQQDRVFEFVPVAMDAVTRGREVLGPEAFLVRLTASLLATTLASMGQVDEADELARAVLDGGVSAGDERSYPSWLARFAQGLAAEERGDFDGAEAGYREARAGLAEVWGGQHPYALPPLGALISMLLDLDRFAAAEPLARELVEACRVAYPEGHGFIGWAEGTLTAAMAGQQAAEGETEPPTGE
jgi:eukaryotic-like serine/threonine-protein kinase